MQKIQKNCTLKDIPAGKWHIGVSDVEAEGKKRGYEKAAKEYQKAFEEIEQEYEKTEKLIKMQRSLFLISSEVLIKRQEELEQKRKDLELQVMKKNRNASAKLGIPLSEFSSTKNCMGSGSLPILDLLRKYKEKKLLEAEEQGYREARALYEKKITAERKRLEELKKKAGRDTANSIGLIIELLDKIADERMKIAELNALLEGDV